MNFWKKTLMQEKTENDEDSDESIVKILIIPDAFGVSKNCKGCECEAL